MKIDLKLMGFDISGLGLSIQRKKMNLIAENIAKGDDVRDVNGQPYQRKTLVVKEKQSPFANSLSNSIKPLELKVTDKNHISIPNPEQSGTKNSENLKYNEVVDKTQGEIVYMPDHPDADENGYVQMSNVNTVTEMVDMISASRAYQNSAEVLNTSKQLLLHTLAIGR